MTALCTQLYGSSGNLYLTCNYDAARHWVHNTWRGPQTFGGVTMGADAALLPLRLHRCAYLFSDCRAVVGSWDQAVAWLLNDWMPRAQAQGLTHLAHVVGPEALATRSAEALQVPGAARPHFRLFADSDSAQAWLREAQQHDAHPVGQMSAAGNSPL